MAGEAYNLWGAAAAITQTNALGGGQLWYSDEITTGPTNPNQSMAVQISTSFTFSASPVVGDSVELLCLRSDGGALRDGGVGASEAILTVAADIEKVLDNVAVRKRVTMSGANTGAHVSSFIWDDPSPEWTYAIYNRSAIGILAGMTITHRYLDPQAQS